MERDVCMTAKVRPDRANWLLRALIIFSVGVHTVVFFHIAGIYRSSALTFIEMSLQNLEPPEARAIPRPRARPKPPPPDAQVNRINVVPRTVPRFKPLAMAPMETRLPDTLVEGIASPDIPQAPSVDSADWVPGPQTQAAAGEFLTSSSYLDMVRLKIESRKRYPDSAKTRSIEGRVTIRFVLLTDGNVRDLTVTKAARSRALNMAALDAVQRAAPFPRPPASLFKGELPLELTIVFELT
jgi:protein TonB